MRHTEQGFWGFAAGYLLVIIGFLLALFAALEPRLNSNQVLSSVICICIGCLTIVSTQRKNQALKHDKAP